MPSYENTARILECQSKFNETGDCQYLWDMKPDLEHAIRSLLIKRSNGYVYPGLYEKAEDITFSWMLYYKQRRDKGNPLNAKSPISYAHYMILLFDSKNPPDGDLVELEAADWYSEESCEYNDEGFDEEYILPNGKSVSLRDLEKELENE